MTDARPSQRYSMLIGSIVAYWSVTEHMCDRALAVLLRIDPNLCRCVTMPIADFGLRLEVLKSVCRQTIKDEEALAEFLAILERVAAASSERNRVVHSVWFNLGYEDLIDTSYSFASGDVPVAESTKYTTAKLKQVLNQIKDATEELTAFLLDRLGMSPSTPSIVIDTPDGRA